VQPGAGAVHAARRAPEPGHRRIGQWRLSRPLCRRSITVRTDHYATLGLTPTATPAEIRTAYRQLARTTHPDATGADPETERRFKSVTRAYEVLSRPSRRRAYDERHQRGRFGSPGSVGRATFEVERQLYHSDLGHHSDFYRAGDPLTVSEAALAVGRDAGWLRRAIRDGRLAATRDGRAYLLRRRDVERLDRSSRRRRPLVVMLEDDVDGDDGIGEGPDPGSGDIGGS
jgi:excisionase family DNA binding protein